MDVTLFPKQKQWTQKTVGKRYKQKISKVAAALAGDSKWCQSKTERGVEVDIQKSKIKF